MGVAIGWGPPGQEMRHGQSKATLVRLTPAYQLQTGHGQHRGGVWVGAAAGSTGSSRLCRQVLGSTDSTVCAGRLWASLGLHGHADWSRLVEEGSSGLCHPSWLPRVRGLQPRGCTQAFRPPHFGVRQARVGVCFESFLPESGVGFLLG